MKVGLPGDRGESSRRYFSYLFNRAMRGETVSSTKMTGTRTNVEFYDRTIDRNLSRASVPDVAVDGEENRRGKSRYAIEESMIIFDDVTPYCIFVRLSRRFARLSCAPATWVFSRSRNTRDREKERVTNSILRSCQKDEKIRR